MLDWPVSERPREKLLRNGAEHLSDAELLAILLRTGSRRYNALELAHQWLIEFGSIGKILQANENEFCNIVGLGKIKFAQFKALQEVCKRYFFEPVADTDILNKPSETITYLQAQLAQLPHEVFACLFLDSQNKIIKYEVLFQGSINFTHIYPREVIKRCLTYNAAAVILAHNHPSGLAEPSHADRELTEKLRHALSLVDIALLDHIIVGKHEGFSFVGAGILL